MTLPCPSRAAPRASCCGRFFGTAFLIGSSDQEWSYLNDKETTHTSTATPSATRIHSNALLADLGSRPNAAAAFGITEGLVNLIAAALQCGGQPTSSLSGKYWT